MMRICPRPSRPPVPRRKAWWLLALAAVLSAAVLFCESGTPAFSGGDEAAAAVRQTQAAYEEIRRLRLEKSIAIDRAADPGGTGLIGVEYSDLTTSMGDLSAKQASVNPVFAGLLVDWLKKAGVRRGDVVAASFSGSFPALNAAALCAFDAIGAEPIIFSSVGASVWGANIPSFTWLDMEKRLTERALVRSRTLYASLGGIADTEGGLDGTGIALAQAAIGRHGARYVPEGTPKTVSRDAGRRMEIFFGRGKPKAFVNVGGNVTSLGWIPQAALLGSGPLRKVPHSDSPSRGVIFRMHERGVPVIHLLNIRQMAARFHIRDLRGEDPERYFAREQSRHQAVLAGALMIWLALAGLFLFLEFGRDPGPVQG